MKMTTEEIGKATFAIKTPDMLVDAIEQRVRKTICATFTCKNGEPVEALEGRISQVDFDTLVKLFRNATELATARERERCAMLHECVNSASDDERHHNVPGANAMGAIIEYRDLIRS